MTIPTRTLEAKVIVIYNKASNTTRTTTSYEMDPSVTKTKKPTNTNAAGMFLGGLVLIKEAKPL